MTYYDPDEFGLGLEDDDEFERDIGGQPDFDPEPGMPGGVLSQLGQAPLQPDQRVVIQKRLDELSESRKGALRQMEEVETGRSRTAEQKRAIIKEAKGRLLKQRPDNTELLLSVSGALLSPTRTGAFTESLGNAASAAAPQLGRMREFETGLASKIADLDLKSLAIDEQATDSRLQSLFKRLGIESSEQRELLAQMGRRGPTAPRPYTFMRGNKKVTQFFDADGKVIREEEGEAWAPRENSADKPMTPSQEAAIDMQIERLIEADMNRTTLPTDVDPEDYRNQKRAEYNAIYKRGAPALPTRVGPDGQPAPRIVGRRLSEGQKVSDREWAKENADFMSTDFAEIEKNINGLQGVINVLEDPKLDTTGAGLTNLLGPDYRRLIPGNRGDRSADIQAAVEAVVQQNLRQVLGGQFAQQEGAQLIKRAYNPLASEAENIAKLRALQESIMAAAKAKKAQADYFRKNNTLAGYEGPAAIWVEPDFNKIDERYKGSRKNPRTQQTPEQRREELIRKRDTP
jgi:hypothetical protein